MTDSTAPDPRRRRLLGGLALGGGALAGGLVGGSAVAMADERGGMRRQTLEVEVAMDMATLLDGTVRQTIDQNDWRAPLLVEGLVYPAGTDLPDGFVLTEEGVIGSWFCRGWTLTRSGRTQPHALTTQEFLFGPIRPDDVFPADLLVTSGVEGADDPGWSATRAVTGGAGRYAGASGQVVQTMTGKNTTASYNGSAGANLRFAFDLLLPATT